MNKTILITGSTDGIGKMAAIQLAKEGHDIYLHGKNSEKLASVISEIKTLSKNEKVKGLLADFSDLEAVSKMAENIVNTVPKIDVLINNAGIYTSKTATNNNGLDIRIVVNYLAAYVLTNALLPLLKKSEMGRIINLSSAAQSPVSESVMMGMERQSENTTYGQSKLALTMWSFDLAAREPDLTVIAVNPGSLLNTKMANEAYGQHWAPAEKGANLLVDLAISEMYKNDSGKYFNNDKGEDRGVFAPAHADVYDEVKIRQLIGVTNIVLGNLVS